MVGLVARLIQIEGHLAALRKGMENGSPAPAAPAAPAASAPPAKKAMRNRHTADIIKHFDKRGTPEVLNRLYHPKYAAPRPADDDSLLKRVAAMPKSLTERSK